MRLRIEIKTPKGYAASTSSKLKPFILGRNKVTEHQIYCNKDDSMIIWIIDAQIKEAMRIQKSLAYYDVVTSSVLKSKVVRLMAHLSHEDQKQLDDMLKKQTTLRIIKMAEEMPDLTGWKKEI